MYFKNPDKPDENVFKQSAKVAEREGMQGALGILNRSNLLVVRI